MVRIGRIESMHEEVKKISVTELAKREAQKTYFDQQHKNSENIEHKVINTTLITICEIVN
jgi:DNA polymerase II large subunit